MRSLCYLSSLKGFFMQEIIFCITIGIVLGWFDIFNYKIKLWLSRISNICLFIMLICLGAKIGCDDNLLAQMDTLGKQSLILGGSAILGSVVMFYIIIKTIGRSFETEGGEEK